MEANSHIQVVTPSTILFLSCQRLLSLLIIDLESGEDQTLNKRKGSTRLRRFMQVVCF